MNRMKFFLYTELIHYGLDVQCNYVYDRAKKYILENTNLDECKTAEEILNCIKTTNFVDDKTYIRDMVHAKVFSLCDLSHEHTTKVLNVFWYDVLPYWRTYQPANAFPSNLDELVDFTFPKIFFRNIELDDLLESIAEEIIEDRNKEMVL